jgi:alpha-mannosidase
LALRIRVVILAGLLAAAAVGVEAQQFIPPPNPLPADSVKALKRLDSLKNLAGVNWQWHAGDLAHGEDPATDDGRWKPLKDKIEAGTGAVWIRARFAVPRLSRGYDITGAALILAVGASPGGRIPAIVYLDSRRIALGADLAPEVIAQPLHPGQEFAIAIKLLVSEPKTLRPPVLELRFAANRPAPTRLRAECDSAAVLLPTLDSDPKVLAQDLAVLESAIATVDFGALDHDQQQGFDASLRKAETMLEPLRPRLATLSVAAVGNSHIDAAWLWPASETMTVAKDTFTSALQLIPEYPGFDYTQPDMQYDAWLQAKYPLLFDEIKSRVKDGRWDLVGGMWAEPDLNEPDGETMTRELLIGKRYLHEQFGKDTRIGWNVDSFGYSWQLPQVYKKSGVDFFVTQKINWNEQNHLPLKLFWWQSPDGSSVLTYFPMSYNGSTDPVQMAQELADARPLAPGLTTIMHLYGVGDHGGGPTRVELDQAENWIDTKPVYPALTLSTAAAFFNTVAPNVSAVGASPVWNYTTLAAGRTALPAPPGSGISIPVWRDELYLETHRGTYTTQAAQKKNMRDSEEWLLDAEKLSSIAWAVGGMAYPQEPLNEAWKKVLFNTNHDLAAGSGIGVIYKDAQVDYDAVHATTNDATQHATDWMTAHADTHVDDPKHEASVIVVNTLAWPREGLATVKLQLPSLPGSAGISVRDAAGKPVAAQVLASDASTGSYTLLVKPTAVPAMGFETLRVGPGRNEVPGNLHVDATTLENSLLRVTLDPKTGCITHLIDKTDGFDSIADGGCGNQLQSFADDPKKYDAWNIDPGTLDKMVPIDEVDSMEVVDKGPLRAGIRIQRHWGSSHFEQTIVLYDGVARVDVENNFDWHETHVLLKAAMPLRASSDVAAFEIPYGVIDRPTTRNNSFEQAKFEVPALRWADLGDSAHGLSLINNSKYGYDATVHLLRLSLLRSPVFPDPNADRGEQRFVYSFYPHRGTWQSAMTERRGYEFNYPLTARQAEQHPGSLGPQHSFLELRDDGVILTALKKSEDGHALIVRAYDWSGKVSDAMLRLPGAPLSASEADMMEHATGAPLALHNGTVHLTMHPYEIKTIRIEYAANGSGN